MKHKAKPAKGSARTQRFDVGGTVGALAGLGTLAYLMSRKKKGEAGKEFGPQGKFPQEDGGGTSGPGMADTTPKVDEAAKRRAMAASAGRPEMGDATNDNIVANESAPPKRNKHVIKKKKDEPPKTPPKVEGFTEPSSDHAKEIKDKFAKFDRDPNKGKYQNTRADAIRGALPGKKPYTDSSGVVYNERGEPYANTTANKKPADKKPADKKPADKKQEATTGAKRTRYAKKKGEEPKRNTKPKQAAAARAKKNQGLIPYASSGREEIMRNNRFHKEAELGRGIKKGGMVKKYSSGGSVSSASKRADGIAIRGKTRA